MSEVVDRLKETVRSMIESSGLECVGIDISRRRDGSTLRIFIDSPSGIKHEDCERVSRAVSDYLDAEDAEGREAFAGAYFVEVSSPGVERPLFRPEHYARFVGRKARLALTDKRRITGAIVSADDEAVRIASDGANEPETIEYSRIKRANLVFEIEKGEKREHKDKKEKKTPAKKKSKK